MIKNFLSIIKSQAIKIKLMKKNTNCNSKQIDIFFIESLFY